MVKTNGHDPLPPPPALVEKLTGGIGKVIKGQSENIRLILAGLVSGGHILLEDNPGTGKTTLAKTLAGCIDADFKRVQFTPDLLPSDILGVSIFDPKKKGFTLHKGPIFTQILLADEINRASPRTQSALLEAMAENQVSIDGRLMPLGELFFVIATQNPIEARGTYPLPEAQMDRFSMQLSLGYVSREEEMRVLAGRQFGPSVSQAPPCADVGDVIGLRNAAAGVHISEKVKFYIVDLVNATRNAPGILLGASTRACISMMKTACALAVFDGRDFVSPSHVREIAVQTIAHRLVLDSRARFSGKTARIAVAEILESVPVPV